MNRTVVRACGCNVITYLFIFVIIFFLLCFFTGGNTTATMEVKTSLLDNMIGVGDMVLLEPMTEESFLENLRKRFDHNEIYVSSWATLS